MNRTLIPLPDCDLANGGGKAAGLARLIAAGLPVPAGCCLAADVYAQALPGQLPAAKLSPRDVPSACDSLVTQLNRWTPDDTLSEQLSQVIEQLGPPLAVRSSASCEDLGRHSSAGVYDSVLDVSELDGLVRAIRCCWTSLWSVASWVTLQSRGRWPGQERMAVLLQRQVAASRGGIALSRAPTAGEVLLVETIAGRPSALARGDVDPQRLFPARDGPIDPSTRALLGEPLAVALRQQVLASESALGCPAEVEWVCDEAGKLWVVQARPDTGADRSPTHSSGVEPQAAAEQQDETCWRWDREHNPEPLSPAHASLIVRIDGELADLLRLRVFSGYLYQAVDDSTAAAGTDRQVEAELAALGSLVEHAHHERPSTSAARLGHAIDRFIAFNRRYIGGLARARRGAAERLRDFLRQRLRVPGDADLLAARIAQGASHDSWQRAQAIYDTAQLSQHDDELGLWLRSGDSVSTPIPAALLPLVERYGSLAASWDVAAPTFAEQPALLRAQLRAALDAPAPPAARVARTNQEAQRTLADLGAPLNQATRQRLAELVHQARRARESAEDDDLLFARALWLIRSALLACGDELVSAGALEYRDQVFGLSIDEARLGCDPGRRLEHSLAERARAGLATWQRQRAVVPPLTVHGGELSWSQPPAGQLARGLGIGGVARGRARIIRRLEQLFEEDLRDLVLVCPTLTPALAAVLPQLAALVTDHGGLLSHAACLARELGLPAVVGTRTATQLFDDGDLVWIDGPRGLAIKLQ